MKNTKHMISIRTLVPALAALALAPFAEAQQPPTTAGTYIFADDTTFDAPTQQQMNTTRNLTWKIDDDVTVTISNASASANGGVFDIEGTTSNNTVFTIAPSGSNGRVIFKNNVTSAEGTIFFQNRASIDITNASFIGNGSTKTTTHGGGVFRIGSTSVSTALTNVFFEKNYAYSLGGAIRTLHGISITSGTFSGNSASGNTATTGYGGAIAASAGGLNLNANGIQVSVITDSYFAGNWASRYGGAIGLDANPYHSFTYWDHISFNNNFAGIAGGAIYDNANTDLLISGERYIDGQRFVYTGTTGVNEYVYSGNIARNAILSAAEITAARNGTFNFSATSAAKAGGFYFSGTAGSQLFFDIAENVTVSIGKASNPSAWDSIANTDQSGTTARIALTGTVATGGGTLILHADNSYFQGSVNVDKGTLLLGNQNAKLGGAITVGDNAAFGGAGELITYKQNDLVFAGRTKLTVGDNAGLQIGTSTAIVAETLTVAGDFSAGTGVTFTHDLFTSGSASMLKVNNFSLAGSGTINLSLLATGNFTLMQWSGSGLAAGDLAKFSLTVDGISSNPRSSASLAIDEAGKKLTVSNTVNNLIMKWTGADGGRWMRRPTSAEKNWADAGGSAENRFFNADTVVFDGIADAASSQNRDITIETGGVSVSGMEVSGSANYIFRGDGGITADANSVGNATFIPTGMLKKSGAGELVFTNTAANTFGGGIEISGGMITFDHARQLGSGTGGITFSDSGTLRAESAISGTLAGKINVVSGKNAELKVEEGGSLVYGGTFSAGSAASAMHKTGDGALQILADNSGYTGKFVIDSGDVALANGSARLGGSITVNSGAALGGIGAAGMGGGVKVASGGILDVGISPAQSGTLTVNNLEMTGGAIVRLNLYNQADGAYRASDRIYDLGTSAISGANTVDLASFASGTFNLGNLLALAAAGNVTINGMELPAGGRITATLTSTNSALELVTVSDKSRQVKWTGGANATWNLKESDWTGSDGVNQYSYGDHVVFDGTADASHTNNRSITIDGAEAGVSDMTVTGNANYTFNGGGIRADASNVLADSAGNRELTAATGKLIKQGSGTLTLANAYNSFAGGIDIDEGVIAFSHGDQLLTSDSAAITFTGNATLRASGSGIVLDDAIVINGGKAGTFDTNGYVMALTGSVSGTTGSSFVKRGDGGLILESDMSAFTGTVAVQGGVLQLGAADMFTASSSVSITVGAGAILDLNNNDQTFFHLSGSGVVHLGDAQLTYKLTEPASEFAGGFWGSGTVVKQGAGKWTLSGSSSHTGGIVWQAGGLGLANSAALGSGTLTIAMPEATLDIDANGLTIANAISAGSGTLAIASNGRAAEFSGDITAGTLALEGTGTLALSGVNTAAGIAVNVPLAIARRADSVSGDTRIATGSVLEFRGVGSGNVTANLLGDRVLLTASTLSLRGSNDLRMLDIAAASRVTAASVNALGGAAANITVRDGSWLTLPVAGTLGGSMRVDGGALVFAADQSRMGSLALSGSLAFANGGEIRLNGLLPTGIYTAAVAYGGIQGAPVYDPHQGGMFMVADIVNGDTLRITAYNKALEPGKDIVVAFDALTSLSRSVYAHISEEFIAPIAGDEKRRSGSSLWFRVIGSYMECGAEQEHIGYTDNTITGLVGYDWISSKDFMLGGYFGHSSTDLETETNATTKMDMPCFGLYAARRMGEFYVSGNLTAGFGLADTERREDFGNIVTGSHKLTTFGGSVEGGWVFPLFTAGEIRPSVGIHYMNLSFHDYAETGQGAVRLDDMRATSLQGVVKVDATKSIKMPWGLPGMVGMSLGWRQNLINEQTDAWATLVAYPDARFQIRGEEFGRNNVIMGLGIRMMLSKSMLFSLNYDYDCAPFGDENSGTGRHTFDAAIRVSW